MEWINDCINLIQGIDMQFVLKMVITVLIVLIFKVFSPLFSIIVLKIFRIKSSTKELKSTVQYRNLKIFFTILGIYIATMRWDFDETLFIIITKVFKIFVIILVANTIGAIIENNTKIIKGLRNKIPELDNNRISNFVVKIIKTIIYIIAGFIIIKEIGYDLSGLVAGIGLRKCSNSPISSRPC